MFADENFFSPSTGSEFLSSEPRKSVGAPAGSPLGAPLGSSTHGFGMSGFGMADEFGGGSEGLSQTQTGSQKTPQTAAAHTPDGCICSTIQMLRRAARERAGGGGPLQLHGREVGLVGLCGFASALEVRSSLFKFTLEDMTSAIEVECANKAVLHKLQQQMDAPEDPAATTTTATATTTTSTELLCKRLKEGGLVSVYGFACTDDKGEVYVDCFKAAPITDPREYAQAFPFRVIAAALKAQGTNPNPALKTEGKQLHRDLTEQQTHNKQEPNEEASLELYEHVRDPLQRQLLQLLLAAENGTISRQTLCSRVKGHNGEAVEEALKALEESGDVAMTSSWVSLAC